MSVCLFALILKSIERIVMQFSPNSQSDSRGRFIYIFYCISLFHNSGNIPIATSAMGLL